MQAGRISASPKAQHAVLISARSFRRHHQHWKAPVPCPAKMPCHCHNMQPIVCLRAFALSRVNAQLAAVEADGSLSRPGASAPVLKRKMQRPLLHVPSGALASIEKQLSFALGLNTYHPYCAIDCLWCTDSCMMLELSLDLSAIMQGNIHPIEHISNAEILPICSSMNAHLPIYYASEQAQAMVSLDKTSQYL